MTVDEFKQWFKSVRETMLLSAYMDELKRKHVEEIRAHDSELASLYDEQIAVAKKIQEYILRPR